MSGRPKEPTVPYLCPVPPFLRSYADLIVSHVPSHVQVRCPARRGPPPGSPRRRKAKHGGSAFAPNRNERNTAMTPPVLEYGAVKRTAGSQARLEGDRPSGVRAFWNHGASRGHSRAWHGTSVGPVEPQTSGTSETSLAHSTPGSPLWDLWDLCSFSETSTYLDRNPTGPPTRPVDLPTCHGRCGCHTRSKEVLWKSWACVRSDAA